MKTPLLRYAKLVTLLFLTGTAIAQGMGRHAMGRGSSAATPPGLGYGAGYQARRMQQAERDGQRMHQNTKRTTGECPSAVTPHGEPDLARAKEACQAPSPARRDACAETKP